VGAAETRKSLPTSKTESRFIVTCYHNTMIMESELTISQNKVLWSYFEKFLGNLYSKNVISFNLLNIVDYYRMSAATIIRIYI
jgi:hypothetical protein